MKNNYLIFYKPHWVSWIMGYPKIKIGKSLKLFVTKNGYDMDRRTKEFKKLMSKKPKYYQGIEANVKTK